jgi:hypothetical protein
MTPTDDSASGAGPGSAAAAATTAPSAPAGVSGGNPPPPPVGSGLPGQAGIGGLGGPGLTPPPGLRGAPPRPARMWQQVERSLVAISLAFTLVMPVVMLLTEHLHHDSRADEKMVALGLGLLFASIALMFLTRLTRSLEGGESLAVESHWGGLGGGVGGWRVSPPLGYLFCVMTFGALAAVAVSQYPDPRPATTNGGEGSPTPAATSGATTSTPPTQQQGTPPVTQTNTAGTKPETQPQPQTKPETPAQTPAAGQTQQNGVSGGAAQTKGQ